jgi:hypothetical protein
MVDVVQAAASAVSREYEASLKELAFNSKPQINALTIVADENRKHAMQIIRTVETRLSQVTGTKKMPLLYLLDSIVKNLGGDYISLVTQNLVSTFCSAFEQADEQMRRDLFKLRQTWPPYFPTKKLHAIDVRVNTMDPNWPVVSLSGPIHVNPKFISQERTPLPDSKSKQVPQPVQSSHGVEVGRGKVPAHTSVENVSRRTLEPKDRSLGARDERQRTAEQRELQPVRQDIRSVPVGYNHGDYSTREQDGPPGQRNSIREPYPTDDRAFKVPDAKRRRLDEYPRDNADIHARHQEVDRAGKVTESPSDDFASTRDAMDVFHRLIRIPPNQLLENENYVLKEVWRFSRVTSLP